MEYQVRAQFPAGLDRMVKAYLECAEWCGIDEEQREAFENAEEPKWAGRSIEEAKATCEEFMEAHTANLEEASRRYSYSEEQAGHDLWLTRNRHGAGFWDRGIEHLGRIFTDYAHTLGECAVWFNEETETLELE